MAPPELYYTRQRRSAVPHRSDVERSQVVSGKYWLLGLCLASFLPLAAADTDDGRTVFVQMGIEESFIVRLKPMWQVFRRRSVDLCYEDFLIRGPENSFNLSMQFCYEDPERLQYDTPAKQSRALSELTSSLYDESYEKARGMAPAFRAFAPGGRCGWALRLTANRWADRTPPPDDPEGKFVTCGLFRIGENSALFFQVWTNSVDDAAYRELLDFIVDLTIPERGDPAWKLSDAAKAVKAAEIEFAKRYPAAELAAMRPYNVLRTEKGWRVYGSRWDADGTVEMDLDGATGAASGVRRGSQSAGERR